MVRADVGEQVLDNYEDIKLGELHGMDAKKVGGVGSCGLGANMGGGHAGRADPSVWAYLLCRLRL